MTRTWKWEDIWDGKEYKITFKGTDSLMWDTVEVLTSSQVWFLNYWDTI